MEKKLSQKSNIILVGFMATGKSHVGRILSKMTGWPLVDADAEIVRRAGKSIPSIFRDEGESAFRDLERSVIADLCAGSNRIIATGGGAFVDTDNRRLLLASGLVFCLCAAPATIHARLAKGEGGINSIRPLLAGDDPENNQIERLLIQRADAYAQAHYTVNTDPLTPLQVAERILEMPGIKGLLGG